MDFYWIPKDFAQASAILRDAYFKQVADLKNKEDFSKAKLLKARENNIDFEQGLADRICGDHPLYKYRKGYELTKFFEDLGFGYKHDGSTRSHWVRDVLLELDVSELSYIIQKGLFKKKNYTDLSIESAIDDFSRFIDESIRANETIDLSEILNLSVNTELLFDETPKISEEGINQLINDAKSRFFKPNDQHIALEKLWDAFERIKTYFEPNNKKMSADKLVSQMSIELEKTIINNEFVVLTSIGNEYQIRHFERDKKPITDNNQRKYLFFRMLALIDLALTVIQNYENNNTI